MKEMRIYLIFMFEGFEIEDIQKLFLFQECRKKGNECEVYYYGLEVKLIFFG